MRPYGQILPYLMHQIRVERWLMSIEDVLKYGGGKMWVGVVERGV